ncbi:hypothetical protein J5N97_017865 [Dioscorea zingiberensis]|uniref:K-box domain-containing protein n=1 Tax=Dioscorea zingiberensis TaxID=325984 RepID=A0A9D5HGS1_9LILI|nr:hypothetical protein J5N97_017865 [Dioscorea zingiberensis]
MRQYLGEDLAALSINDLDQLEEQLEYSVNKVRARKLVEHQAAMEHHHHQAAAAAAVAAEHKVTEMPVLDQYSHFYHDDTSRTLLQLSPQLPPFRLQPTQPNLQDTSFPGHGLQLWYIYIYINPIYSYYPFHQ